MSKKKRKENIFNNLEIESAEPNAELTESTSAGEEALHPDADLQNDEPVEIPADAQVTPPEESNAASSEETTADDLLGDVRRSLMEEESERDGKKPKWWRRLRKEKKAEAETPVVPEEVDLPVADLLADQPAVQAAGGETEEYLDQIDELIDMLEPETDQAVDLKADAEPQVQPEPEKPIDIDELKKRAFRPGADGGEPENYSEVRTIALDGGEEVFVEVESKAQDPLKERVSAFENALKPYRRYIYFAFAFLGVVVLAIASLMLFDLYERSRPAPPVEEVESNLPYPTSLGLPGGLNFTLGRGKLENDKWNPRGPEWLEGTEVCRWVALPWSRQVEAVVRTLTQKDEIGLVMSNGDRLSYQVYSIREMSFEELQKLDSSSPCLLLILARQDSETRWVVTALP
jgi:hypothetical protein